VSDTSQEAARIEQLWSGEFGTEYLSRNPVTTEARRAFWQMLLTRYPASSVLEVGCNLGANLRPIRASRPGARIAGIDINPLALATLHSELPSVALARAAARRLPFHDASHELVFTCGVLIHQPPEVLPHVMREIVRCSARYVLCAEYFAEDWQEMPYRGQERALFKGDFGREYLRLFPELRLLDTGFLPKAEGWGDVTYWLMERGGLPGDSAPLE
jgi:spore coat polysaccharide biosynthesis protein SpsF